MVVKCCKARYFTKKFETKVGKSLIQELHKNSARYKTDFYNMPRDIRRTRPHSPELLEFENVLRYQILLRFTGRRLKLSEIQALAHHLKRSFKAKSIRRLEFSLGSNFVPPIV